jgi:hypothetical protein
MNRVILLSLLFIGLTFAATRKVINGLDNVSWEPKELRLDPGDTVVWEWFVSLFFL